MRREEVLRALGHYTDLTLSPAQVVHDYLAEVPAQV
jgi:hypothetical protein